MGASRNPLNLGGGGCQALKQSRAYRIAWLLELLELEYQIELIERDKQTFLAPDTLRQTHALGKSPILQDGNLTLAESGAIVEYLLARYNPEQRFKPIVQKIVAGVRNGYLQPQLDLHLNQIEQALVGQSWLVGGQLSAADVMMSFPLIALVKKGLKGFPNIHAYVKRIEQQQAYQRAEAKLGVLSI